MNFAFRARPVFELGLDGCAFLFLPVLAVASRGTAALAGLAGVFALGLAWPAGAAAWRRVRGAAAIFAALVLWGLVSALWAVDPGHSAAIAMRLAGLFAAGLALMAAAEEVAAPGRLAACFGAGLALALVLAVVQFETDGMLSRPFLRRPFVDPALNQVENALVVMLPPLAAMLVLTGRRVLAALATAAVVAVVGLLVGDAGHLALALAAAGAVLVYAARRPAARVLAAVSVAAIAAAPLVLPRLAEVAAIREYATTLKSSAWHRLEIWRFAGSRIAEHPVAGWGLDSSRAIPGGDRPIPGGLPWQLMLPLHPHNAALQLWLELGVPGAVLFALFAARLWLAVGAAPWPRLYAAAAGGSLAAAFTIALGAYGVWEEWWIAGQFLALFVILVMARLV
jgi:exopolysaccharide production protein ExoQ